MLVKIGPPGCVLVEGRYSAAELAVTDEPVAMPAPVTKLAEPIPGRAESNSVTRVEPKPVAVPIEQSPVAQAAQSAASAFAFCFRTPDAVAPARC